MEELSLGIVRHETGIVVVRSEKERVKECVVEREDLQQGYREDETRFQAHFVKGDGLSPR